MPIVLAFFIFIVSLFVLSKSASYFLDGASALGKAIRLSPFLVGAIIIGFGTSIPEFVISVFAVIQGANSIPIANAIGSNIANILFVLGLTAIIVSKITIQKYLIDIELPLLLITTVVFIGVSYDGIIVLSEALLLIAGFIIYLHYILLSEDKRTYIETEETLLTKVKSVPKDFLKVLLGVIGVAVSSHLTISSTIDIATFFNVSEGVIAATAIAFGTSLPEVVVSIKAAIKKQTELVVGNIMGSNIFNLLFVVGIPGLFAPLFISGTILSIGLPLLIAVTLIFVISGISNRIHIWEGLLFILLYVFFIIKVVL